jgi:hypothetical protein
LSYEWEDPEYWLKPLSAKQKIYVQAVLKGHSSLSAARKAGYAETYLHQSHYKLQKNDKVVAALAGLRRHAPNRRINGTQDTTRDTDPIAPNDMTFRPSTLENPPDLDDPGKNLKAMEEVLWEVAERGTDAPRVSAVALLKKLADDQLELGDRPGNRIYEALALEGPVGLAKHLFEKMVAVAKDLVKEPLTENEFQDLHHYIGEIEEILRKGQVVQSV